MNTDPPAVVAASASLRAFWDASGIVPLCCLQAASVQARQAARIYLQQVVWWGTSVEVVSAFQRLIREGFLPTLESQQAFSRLAYLRRRWDLVPPDLQVRDLAESMLGAHKLRAADALQLAAALFWCGHHPRGRYFIGADHDLLDAADKEGFTVVRLR